MLQLQSIIKLINFMTINKNSGEIVSTMGFIGFVKYASGTIGSLVTTIIAYFILLYFPYSFLILLILFQLSITYGTYEVFKYLKATNKSDPKEVIIDEFAGQSLTILLIMCYLKYNIPAKLFLEKISNNNQTTFWAIICAVSFVFFRVFDIAKPFPVSYFDKMNNAFGVMMDDIVAGIMAALTIIVLLKIFS